MRYFAKRDLNVLPVGIDPSLFQRLVPGYGHLATEDPAILKIIDSLGGKSYAFTEITAADWEKTLDLAKKNAWTTKPTSADPRNVLPQLRPSAANLEAAVAAGEAGSKVIDEGPAIPTSIVLPTTPPPHEPVETAPTTRKNPLLKKNS